MYTHLVINLKTPDFDALAPQFWGEPAFQVPQSWGASAVLGSPQVEQLAWI
ncbi:hypothetical protein [Microcoleus sp. FACHB-68]|uniref:hypothetical protein n=1 Tax=Microcoleus sp. FACHB-68 TaxID=2692826 RepID=UPI001684C7AE|nr:hypothetical protein [Microcoleus sp. FACHB-68]MBD1935857.1 hypothetical protein [Microcoleus sp. FACHB-68]